MSTNMSMTTGEMNFLSTSDIGSGSIEENWWIKYGRFVEFQLIFTNNEYTISNGTFIAKGLPKPMMAGTFSSLDEYGQVTVQNGKYVSDEFGRLKANSDLTVAKRHILHGVYIAES